jgi:hypothetical protein
VAGGHERGDEAPAPGSERAGTATRTIDVRRPAWVTWIATYSFLVAGAGVLIGLGTCWFFAARLLGAPPLAPGVTGRLWPSGAPHEAAPLMVTVSVLAGGLGVVLPVWHTIVGFGIFRLRNWARFHLIVLAVLELPSGLLPLASWVFVLLLPLTIASVAVLVYLFRPSVARLFQLGLGPATLREQEAEELERLMGGA